MGGVFPNPLCPLCRFLVVPVSASVPVAQEMAERQAVAVVLAVAVAVLAAVLRRALLEGLHRRRRVGLGRGVAAGDRRGLGGDLLRRGLGWCGDGRLRRGGGGSGGGARRGGRV